MRAVHRPLHFSIPASRHLTGSPVLAQYAEQEAFFYADAVFDCFPAHGRVRHRIVVSSNRPASRYRAVALR